jgi:hypothetical protein
MSVPLSAPRGTKRNQLNVCYLYQESTWSAICTRNQHGLLSAPRGINMVCYLHQPCGRPGL